MKFKKVPRNDISKWNEKRVIKFFMSFLLIYSIIVGLFHHFFKFGLIAGFDVGSLFEANGDWHSVDECSSKWSAAISYLSFTSLIQISLMFWAIHAQSKIDSEYNISWELKLVTLFWTLCNQIIAGTWVLQLNWLGLLDFDSDGDQLSID